MGHGKSGTFPGRLVARDFRTCFFLTVRLIRFVAFVDGRAQGGAIPSGLFPCVWIDCKGVQLDFESIFEEFFAYDGTVGHASARHR
ncbi:hypothetical protein DPMN_094776 [Dreissena polymorpha]|uniref:Uncharacterized protein n=1 Tax=Dreissena polymorpha TaxID=45954 RepID=A0A9D4L6R4_DREPO|nr:hypothetical protein DPMN_094776 [Dreissena polymorpha]